MVSVVCFIKLYLQADCLKSFLLVVISAGNNGAKGAFTTGAPGNSESAFEVASVNNEYLYYDGSFNVTGFIDPIGKFIIVLYEALVY